jgi:peptidyl-prolyl cis-trans isomerase SurA
MQYKLTSFLFTALLVAAPAAADIIILEEIVAKVNGDVVTRSQYMTAIEEFRRGLVSDRQLSEEEKAKQMEGNERNSLRNLIDELLLVQKGNELEYNIESQVLRQRDSVMQQYDLKTLEEFEVWASERFGMPIEDLMDQMRRNVMSNTVLQQEVAPRLVISQEDMQKYYAEHKAQFIRKDSVRLSQIFISTADKEGEELEEAKKTAEEVSDRVHRGEPFAEMAARFSEDEQTKARRGDLGVFERGVLRKEIEDQVFDKNSGFITDLIEVPNGYLLLKVDQRFREGQAEFEEVQEEVRGRLAGPLWNPAVRDYLNDLRREAYIEIRPGYVDSGAVAGISTDWSDPAKLAPVTTTKEELLQKKKNPKLLWMIPLPGGGGDEVDE